MIDASLNASSAGPILCFRLLLPFRDCRPRALAPARLSSKARLVLRCLRVAHDAADYWSARVTEPHSIRVVVISEKFPLWNHLMRKLGFLCFF